LDLSYPRCSLQSN